MEILIKAKYEGGFLCVDTSNIPEELHKVALREAETHFYKNYGFQGFKNNTFEIKRKVVYKVIKELES